MIFIHSLHAGGAERVAVDLANQWHIHGHDVMVVTQTDARGDVYELNRHVERVALNTAGLRGVMANLRRCTPCAKPCSATGPISCWA